MGIQKIRFPERFLVEICVDEDLMDCKVLKFILQPIVENSYKYGFAEKRKKNVLCIRGYREKEDDIIIIIEDNGCLLYTSGPREGSEREPETRCLQAVEVLYLIHISSGNCGRPDGNRSCPVDYLSYYTKLPYRKLR